MATSAWFILAGVSLLYVILGLWAVSQIFPDKHGTAPENQQQESCRT